MAIEVDDQSHDMKYDYDRKRTESLSTLGITILRIPNREVETNMDGVIAYIKEYLLKNYKV